MNKIASVIILAILLTACGHSDTANEEAAFVMNTDEIVNAFLNDEAGATKKYADQVIQITGTVMELVKENGQITGIKLSADEFNIVSGSLQNPLSVEEIQPIDGQVTIKGICSGFNGDLESMLPGGTVELKRVTLVNQQ